MSDYIKALIQEVEKSREEYYRLPHELALVQQKIARISLFIARYRSFLKAFFDEELDLQDKVAK